ncbi:MAG: hypothetical protein Tsb009_06120 [Planctomycetaceae bacterium]
MTIQRITQLPQPPARDEDSHKGSFGKVLILGGSRGMSGAVALAGLGALRGGAGLVYCAVPKSIQPIVSSIEPSYLTIGLNESARGTIELASSDFDELKLHSYDAIAIGPGIGRSEALTKLVNELFLSKTGPMVMDADALNALAELSQPLPTDDSDSKLPQRTSSDGSLPPRILTPHPGEFSRLTGCDISSIERNREKYATNFARENQVILVLKGHRTIITDGTRIAINTTGNNGMATGGSGDVLTGLITALLGQQMPPFEAAQLGVHLHGLAGDLAARELSQPGMIASDLPRFLPAAWQELSNPNT